MMLGIVADDITGAGDIGSMTAKAGYLTHIHTAGAVRPSVLAEAEVAILDTDSRLDGPQVAYEKVHSATLALKEAGCEQFVNKTCSVFRGNIGTEFDAMLDALDEDFAIVVLGFPKNGRLTKDGIHYVHGRRLEDSAFRHDPVHPTVRSNLLEILQAQTERKVAGVSHKVIARGAEALHETIQHLRTQATYLILDVVDQASLTVIAQAVKDCRVLCGSSALAEVLPQAWKRPTVTAAVTPPPQDGLGVLCVAGSLTPQTTAQISYLKEQGVRAFALETARLFEPALKAEYTTCLAGEVAAGLERGEDVLLHSANESGALQAARAQGAAQGLPEREVARRVSSALAEIADESRARTGFRRLVVAGGDTSATVCRRLGITSMQVGQELEPGLPSCVSLPGAPDERSMLLVLKSGSFGGRDFLARAMDHVRQGGQASCP